MDTSMFQNYRFWLDFSIRFWNRSDVVIISYFLIALILWLWRKWMKTIKKSIYWMTSSSVTVTLTLLIFIDLFCFVKWSYNKTIRFMSLVIMTSWCSIIWSYLNKKTPFTLINLQKQVYYNRSVLLCVVTVLCPSFNLQAICYTAFNL